MKKSVVNDRGIVESVGISEDKLVYASSEVMYSQLVTEYIRERYSQDDEFAINSKSMQIYLNNCTEAQKDTWTKEILDFTNYRLECIAKAKLA